MGYRRILVAIDQIGSNDKAISVSRLLARQTEASVTLLHAIKKLPTLTFYYSLMAFDTVKNDYSETIQKKLNDITVEMNCNTLIEYGSTKSMIKKYSKELCPDLIVIKKGRVAKSLLQSSSCDMLIVSRK